MEYRVLGKTGLKVSVVGFGASPLGEEFGGIGPAEGRRAVERAIELGINYFDVSPYYGRTLAEKRLGEYLEGRRDRVVLATKTGRYDAALETGFDFSAKRVRSSVEESLRRLRTDRIDVFQVHDLEFGDIDRIVGETLPAMMDLKRQGKVRFVGITGYPVHALRRVAEAVDVDTILSYCRYDLLDTAMDRVVAPFARPRGIGLINASPLHMRVLTERGAPDWHPSPARVHEAGRKAAAHCRGLGLDIADLAMRFALSYEPVATTLVGMSRVEHVERNAALVGQRPDPRLLAEVLEILRPASGACWRSGRPENDDPGAEAQRAR